jgi:hypothetical protein
MTVAWIVLSTRWDFANVQATINVIINIIGTIGIWAFSRFWWQHGSSKIIKRDKVPLSRLYNPSNPGDALDIIMLAKKRVFSWRHFPLLAQSFVIMALAIAMALNGPIARYALRTGQIVQQRNIEGLRAVRGGGPAGNRVSAQVIWNDTIQSLEEAGYPENQFMDFLPPTTVPWVYREGEWDPTWQGTCNGTDEQPLNVTADPNYTFSDAIDMLPAFRDTVDPSLLNTSIYRRSVDWCGWIDWSLAEPVKDVFFFVLLSSEPTVDNQLNLNQNPLFISISAIRIHSAAVIAGERTFADEPTWILNGTVGNASYTRVECTFARKQQVDNESLIPWPWTNDTASIATGYGDYYRQYVGVKSANDVPIPLPSSNELLRYYQVYVAVMSTGIVTPMIKTLSLNFATVALSLTFLAFMLLFTILILVGTIRYTVFCHQNKKELEEISVPDAKIDWMVHVSKASGTLTEHELGLPPWEHFQSATFERHALDTSPRRIGRVQSMGLPPVHLSQSRGSVTGTMREKKGFEFTIREYSKSRNSMGSNKTKLTSSDVAPDVLPNVSQNETLSCSVSLPEPISTREKTEEDDAILPV